jgi:hypothetical protein
MYRAAHTIIYGGGLRAWEVCSLRVSDIVPEARLRHDDSDRMLIHVDEGEGCKDREVMLGHAKLTTTARYAHLATRTIRDTASPYETLKRLQDEAARPGPAPAQTGRGDVPGGWLIHRRPRCAGRAFTTASSECIAPGSLRSVKSTSSPQRDLWWICRFVAVRRHA